jgi:hypothetical protein
MNFKFIFLFKDLMTNSVLNFFFWISPCVTENLKSWNSFGKWWRGMWCAVYPNVRDRGGGRLSSRYPQPIVRSFVTDRKFSSQSFWRLPKSLKFILSSENPRRKGENGQSGGIKAFTMGERNQKGKTARNDRPIQWIFQSFWRVYIASISLWSFNFPETVVRTFPTESLSRLSSWRARSPLCWQFDTASLQVLPHFPRIQIADFRRINFDSIFNLKCLDSQFDFEFGNSRSSRWNAEIGMDSDPWVRTSVQWRYGVSVWCLGALILSGPANGGDGQKWHWKETVRIQNWELY